MPKDSDPARERTGSRVITPGLALTFEAYPWSSTADPYGCRVANERQVAAPIRRQ